ncbi:hypothetical protein C0992_011705 [Termitomyces sp. T32_za158]|nr:hypothetical protein C0992_011705 [Termitomyces sp. T32_za158]
MNTDFDKDFVVHNYTTTATQPPQSLLYTAYELIRDARAGSTDWVDVTAASAPLIKIKIHIRVGQSKNVVQYPPFLANLHGYEKPLRDGERERQTDDDWGTPILDRLDVFALEDLDEFPSTDLSSLFTTPSEQKTISNPPRSVPRIPIEEGPLFAYIPQPHVHPSSHINLTGPLKLIPYTKTKPIPIPPRTGAFSPAPYSRSAWVVPIRGRPPWERCTAALVLDSACEAYIDDFKDREEIIWTRASVRAFWGFLLEIKTSGSAGAVGLSFHAAREAPRRNPSPSSDHTSHHAESHHTASAATPGYDGRSQPTARTATRASLSALDYIKVYHEGPNAMHLRNMLHLWAHSEPCLEGKRKIRVLRGAKLALVDERSRGILVS